MQKRKAQSLLEIVLSIGIASMILTALVILAAASVKTSNSSLRRSEASKLAAAGVEAIRYQRDSSGLTGLENGCYTIDSYGTIHFIPIYNCQFPGYEVGNGFTRQILVEDYASSDEMKKVTVTVNWQETATAAKQVVISTVLSGWKN